MIVRVTGRTIAAVSCFARIFFSRSRIFDTLKSVDVGKYIRGVEFSCHWDWEKNIPPLDKFERRPFCKTFVFNFDRFHLKLI